MALGRHHWVGRNKLQACVEQTDVHRCTWPKVLIAATTAWMALSVFTPIDALAGRRGASKKPKVTISNAMPFVGARAAKPAGQGGVGMVLGRKGGHLVIARVVPGGPAARAGVLSGDRIVSVDRYRLPKDIATSAVAARIRGPVGSACALSLWRPIQGKEVKATIVRGSMSALFPQVSQKVIVIEKDLRLVATGNSSVMGVHFLTDASKTSLIRYKWVIAPRGTALGSGAVNLEAKASML